MDLSVKLGKTPTEVNDYPGFVANRILMPMINESIETLYNGVAGVEEIDTVMKLGMAHPMPTSVSWFYWSWRMFIHPKRNVRRFQNLNMHLAHWWQMYLLKN